MVRKNWAKFRRGFYGFNIHRLAKAKGDKLLNRDGVIKNKKKAEAIIKNAKEFQKIRREERAFSDFLKILKEREEKEAIRILSERLAHLGKYSAQYYLHSVGY
jgi:DNA-3-methyladenine glycosylase I